MTLQDNRIRIAAAVVVLAGIGFFAYRLAPVDARAPETQRVTVYPGEGVNEIIADLSARSLIKSARLTGVYAILTGSAHRFKPGSYELSQAMPVSRIIRLLVAGPPEVTVLIREGAGVADIDLTLSTAGVTPPGALLAISPHELASRYPFLDGKETLEGFLFPDTYRFVPGMSAQEVASRFLETFSRKALPLVTHREGSLRADWYQTLITASLLEREVPSASDRRVVAGIFRKRLSIGMALQVDATVTYAICGGYSNCPPLTRSDFALSSPLNTYQHPGLPPQPIANPGIGALTAALSPQSSPYLYYLSDPATGKTVFAATLEEHNGNRAAYLRL